MNRILSLTAILILLLSTPALAQKGGARPAFDAGDNAIGVGIGISPARAYGLYTGYTPAFILNYEHGIVGNLGPGTLSIGGEFGIYSTYYDFDPTYNARWTTIALAARAIYHLTILKNKNNKFDPYGGLAIGFYNVNYTRDYPGYARYGSQAFVAPFVGAKYNFTRAFGVWTELGLDITILKLGLNFNF